MWKDRYISTRTDFLYRLLEFYKRRAGYVIMYKVDLNSDLGEVLAVIRLEMMTRLFH